MTTPRTSTRPRPPAQTRRTSSTLKHSATPPPPYVLSFPSILSEQDSPGYDRSADSTFTELGPPGLRSVNSKHELATAGSSSEFKVLGVDDDAWLGSKSHEELSGLLLKADGVIRDRERGTLI